MATQAQRESYCNEHFQGKRQSIRNSIKAEFELTNNSYTIRELSIEMNCTYKYLQPRVSELLSSGYLFESGSKIEEGVSNSIFSINRNLDLFDRKKMSKFELLELSISKCCYPEMASAIMDEYNRLKK
jgi:hypothetical protein